MEKRQEQILATIIKEHIRTGAPVGSEAVVNKYRLGVSSATVRNEMAALEQAGLIIQPHTSAGRVPTESAYRLYLTKLKEKKLSSNETEVLGKMLDDKDEQAFKQTAKALAGASGMAVFWAFHRLNLYYTDRMDEIIDEIFDRTEFGPRILLGSNNPFSPICSTIMSKYKSGDNTGLFGLLGPIRQDYEKNLAFVNFINDKLNTAHA
jgi:heat-inducible transcriptional repressor